eukprot:4994087-Amphidinium_carterae.1
MKALGTTCSLHRFGRFEVVPSCFMWWDAHARWLWALMALPMHVPEGPTFESGAASSYCSSQPTLRKPPPVPAAKRLNASSSLRATLPHHAGCRRGHEMIYGI